MIGVLFCSFCRKEISIKLSTIKDHIGDPPPDVEGNLTVAAEQKLCKHQRNKINALKEEQKQTDMVSFVEVLFIHSVARTSLDRPFSAEAPARWPQGEGEKLPAEVVAYRIEVLETILKAGDPVERVDVYRALLERNGFSLTSAPHMRQLLPILSKKTKVDYTSELQSKFVSIIFDGTDHFGELLLIFVRFWNGNKWMHRIIRLRHSDHPLDNRALSFILDRACLGVGLVPGNVLGFIKDSVSVNSLAVTNLGAAQYTNALNMPCFSHIFNRIGKRMRLDLANNFIKTWSSYFAVSLKVP